MRIHQERYEHPTQGSSVFLNVYEQEVPADSPAAEQALRGKKGFLVTEDRVGSSRVVSTLGFYDTREDALAAVHARGARLGRQSWRAVTSAA
jgi:hypothetical protein